MTTALFCASCARVVYQEDGAEPACPVCSGPLAPPGPEDASVAEKAEAGEEAEVALLDLSEERRAMALPGDHF